MQSYSEVLKVKTSAFEEGRLHNSVHNKSRMQVFWFQVHYYFPTESSKVNCPKMLPPEWSIRTPWYLKIPTPSPLPWDTSHSFYLHHFFSCSCNLLRLYLFLFSLCIVPLHPSIGGSDSKKKSACNAGDMGSIPGWERSPGEGNDNPLQCSFLENSMDREAWWATAHGVAMSWTTNTFIHNK